ncbi:MAG: 23S rRNA (guanosine(2251)-2'-O)-methyltransferase RlmB [Calditrichaeota bacterium]|nr:23S rRNA (guanosine(2251)-2'-O)-methyltransferase RlmB [Calditrichota bacterium]
MSRILYGIHPIQMAIDAEEPIEKIMVSKSARGPRVGQLISRARKKEIPVQYVAPDVIKKKAESKASQGILAWVAEVRWYSLEDLLDKLQSESAPLFLLILDQIEDPHNLGAIARSAEAFGAHGLIVPQRRSAPLSGTASKAAAGALEILPIARVKNLNRAIEMLQANGIRVIGTDEKGEMPVWQAALTNSVAIVIGNEGKGMRRLVREKCDERVQIPLRGKTPSLNASVAAGIVCYEVFKQRVIKGSIK